MNKPTLHLHPDGMLRLVTPEGEYQFRMAPSTMLKLGFDCISVACRLDAGLALDARHIFTETLALDALQQGPCAETSARLQ